MAQRSQPFDLDAFMRQAARRKRLIPKEQPLVLRSLDFASVLRGHEPGRVSDDDDKDRVLDFANGLQSAGSLYYRAADMVATRPDRKRGRPKKEAEIAFIYAMARKFPWQFRWRIYDPIQGVERPTTFQRICRLWFRDVDPDRQLTPHDFVTAKRYVDRMNKNHKG